MEVLGTGCRERKIDAGRRGGIISDIDVVHAMTN
jgi:hypothetical protein